MTLRGKKALATKPIMGLAHKAGTKGVTVDLIGIGPVDGGLHDNTVPFSAGQNQPSAYGWSGAAKTIDFAMTSVAAAGVRGVCRPRVGDGGLNG